MVVMCWEILQSEEWISHFVSYISGLDAYSSTVKYNQRFIHVFLSFTHCTADDC